MTPPRTEAYERLALDGGWLTAAQLAMECGMNEQSVDRTLHRQAAKGWIEKRIVELAHSEPPPGYNQRDQPRRSTTIRRRVEYRAVNL